MAEEKTNAALTELLNADVERIEDIIQRGEDGLHEIHFKADYGAIPTELRPFLQAVSERKLGASYYKNGVIQCAWKGRSLKDVFILTKNHKVFDGSFAEFLLEIDKYCVEFKETYPDRSGIFYCPNINLPVFSDRATEGSYYCGITRNLRKDHWINYFHKDKIKSLDNPPA